MRIIYPILFLVLVTSPASGNSKVDSLKQLLERHTTTDKAEVLWGIAYELFDTDNAQALFYAERAYHDVWKRGDSLQMVKVGTTYGQLLRRMGKLDGSIEVSSRMLQVAKRNGFRKHCKMLLNSLGLAYVDKARFDAAIDYNYQSLVLRLEDGDTMEIVTALQNLGLAHVKINDFDKSIEYTTRSIELIQSIKPPPNWAAALLRVSYINLGTVCLTKRQYEGANHFFRKAFLLRKNKDYPETFGNLVWEFADSFLGLGQIDSAKYYAELAIKIGLTETNHYAMAQGYILISRILRLEQRWSHASQYLRMAETIDKKLKYPLLHRAILRENFYLLALKEGGVEVSKALAIHERYSDSLDNAVGLSKINTLQVAFAQRENESRLKAQAAVMSLQAQNLDRLQIFIFVVSTMVIVLFALALALHRANKQKHQINQMLDRLVEARTLELSRHRDALQHLIDEENGRRAKATAEMTGLVKSLKGLLHLAKLDPKGLEADYLDKAMTVTLQMDALNLKYCAAAHRTPPIPAE